MLVEGARSLRRLLEQEAAAGRTNIYYDDVVGGHIDELELRILDLTGAPWVEIDDLTDMAAARAAFEKERRP